MSNALWIAIFVMLISFATSLVANKTIILLTEKMGFGIDHPSKRKVHNKPVARLGGVGILLGMLTCLYFLKIDKTLLTLLLGGIFIFIVGLWDDLYALSGKIKILLLIISTFIVIGFSGLRVESLGNLVGLGEIRLGYLAIPFTVFATVGLISAINFIDGLNGLAGGLSLLPAVIMLGLGFHAVSPDMALLDCAFIGALAGFLIYNFPHGRIFMGDSGSMLLGYWLSIFLVFLFGKDNHSYRPMIAVLLLFVPIFDAIRLTAVRIIKSKSPFTASYVHVHHIFYRSGVSHKNTTLLLYLVAIIPAYFALVTRVRSGWEHLLFAILYASLLGLLLEFMIKNSRFLAKRMKGISRSQNNPKESRLEKNL
jgi:UDP-GlcNAc:undecaprenyl-phosphate GlcNAc-1-phosphate transferase